MRKIAKLGRVSEKIQTEFTLLWTDSRQPLCDDSHAFLDAMRVLFPRYQGRAARLFRGAGTDGIKFGRKRKLSDHQRAEAIKRRAKETAT